jgi:hypothetical protein
LTISEKDTRPQKGRIRLLGEVIYSILGHAIYDVLKWGVVKVFRKKNKTPTFIRSNTITITVMDSGKGTDSVSVSKSNSEAASTDP